MATKLVLLLVFVAGAFAGPLSYWDSDSTTCATTCPERTKFRYEPGKTYEYTYESDLKTSIPGATEEHSSLHMRSTVQVEVMSQCEMVLKLSDVSLQDSDPSQYETRTHVERALDFKRALQEKPLRFAFVDGRIENICPESEESWALNVKRGVLSSFQNTMYSLENNMQTKETDVSGTCPVSYEVTEKTWSTRKLKKTKDLLACTDRHGHESAFQSTPYRVSSNIQSLPLVKSTHECEQEVNTDGLMIQSTCTEIHTFRPFSKDTSGATTAVNYKLIFRRQFDGVQSTEGAITTRETLLFNHEQTADEIAENFREARETLSQLCEQTTNDIRPETPALFADLVRKMRKLDSRSLTRLHSSANGVCDKAEKFFHDAVPMVGSAASLELIYDLIKKGDVQGNEAEVWLTNMAFIAKPTKEMISVLKPFLSLAEPFRKTSLTVSTLVHSYCRSVSDCEEDETVQAIITELENNLRYNCVSEDEAQHDKVLMSLKAIGNAGYAKKVVPTLNRCFKNSDLSAETRVAALGAFRRMGCEADRSELIELLTNQREDSEIRIGGYLALMTCPKSTIIDRVRSLLETEEVNQVGSFIWTHLTNLAETSAPHKQEIREILENKEIAKTFDLDKRKFSRNIEWSLFSEMINTGAMIESNIIFSSESFVPRSAMVNLTVDMFGESMNLLELGGRVQGMEKLLESVFGPEGELTNMVETRQKRSADNVNTLDNSYGLKRDAAQASYYLRVFGNEIRYDDFHNFDISTLKDNMNYLEWLIELAKEHKFETTKSFMFLDSTLKIPTAVGMPLRLYVDGTTTVNVAVTGKFDIRKMATYPSTVEINGSVKPSAAVEIRAEMGVDAHVTKTGLAMVNILHTSTVADGRISVKESKTLNLDLNMPQDKMEILTAESKFYVTHRDQERPQEMITKGRREYKKCTTGKALGLELCGELEFPYAYKKNDAPWFPLTGPSTAKLYVTKKDSWTGINFEAKYSQDKKRNADRQWEITDNARLYFNMPGSRNDREMLAELTLERANMVTKFNMKTPWVKTDFDGSIINTEELKQISAKAVLNERKTYSFLAELAKEDKKLRDEYTPKMEIVIPGRDTIRMTGDIAYREAKKAEVNLRLVNLFRDPVVFKGDLEKRDGKKGTKLGGDITIKSRVIDAKVSGFYSTSDDAGKSYATRLETEYQYMNNPKQKFTFNNKLKDQSTKNLVQYASDTAWTSTMFPRYDGDVKLSLINGRTTFNTNFEAGFDAERRVIFEQTGNFVWNRNAKNIDGKVAFKVPIKNVDFEASASHELLDDAVNTNALVRYAPNKEGKFEMALQRESKKPLKLNADISLHYPGREMSLKESIEEKQPGEYHHSLDLTLAKYQKVRLTSVYKMQPRHEVTAELNLPGMTPITVSAHLNPDLMNVQLRGEASYDSRTYLAEFNAVRTGSAERYTHTTTSELSWPERQCLGKTVFSKNNDIYTINMETKYDARRDASQKVTLNGQLTATEAAPAISIQFQTYPGHFLNLNANGKYATTGWFETDEDLEGSMTMTSSIPYLEQISGNFKYDHGPRDVKTSGEISWAEGKKITTEVSVVGRQGWNIMNLNVKVGTPFRGFHTMTGSSSYTLSGKSLTTNNKVTWERNAITLDLTHTPGRKAYDGEIKITTPFEAYEILSTSVSHRWDGQTMKNTFESVMGSNKITLVHNMQHSRQGFSITNTGDVTLTTPFSAIRQGRFSWNHANTDETLKATAEVECNNQKGSFDIEGSHEKSNRKRSFALNARLQTPFNGARDAKIGITHEHNIRFWTGIKTEINAGPISYSHEIDFSSPANNELKIKFNSPFENFERVMLKSEITSTGDKYVTSQLLKWASNDKMTLDGSFEFQGDMGYTTSLLFTSPFQYAERLALNSNFVPTSDRMAFHVDAEYGADYRYVIDSIGHMSGRTRRSELSLETSHRAIRSMKLIQEMTGTLRNFVHTKDFTLNGDQSILKIVSNTENLDNIMTSIELTTPYTAVRSAKIDATHKRSGETYITEANIDVPSYSGSARHEMTINSATNFNSNTVVTYMRGQNIAVTTSFTTSPNVEGHLSVTTPFEGFERQELKFTHSGRLSNFKTGAELVRNGRQKTNFDVEFMTRGNVIRSSARFTSPYREVERIAASFNHRGPMDNFRSEMSLEFNNERMNGETEFSFDRTTLKAKSVIQTPFSTLRSASVEINHNGGATDFTNNAVVIFNGRNINANSRFAVTSGSFHLDTPFREVANVDVSFEHAGQFKNFKNSATASFNGQAINANSEFNFRRRAGKVHIDTPMREFRNLDVSFSHNGGLTNFNNEITFNYNQQEITLTGRLSDSPVSGTFRIETPFDIRSMEVAFTHEGESWTRFTTAGSVSYNNNKINANTAFDWDGITGSLHIDTPYRSLSNMDASFIHNGKNWRNFENSGSFELNGMKYTGDSEFRWFGKAFRARATVKTPDEYSIKINHKGDRNSFNNKAVIGVNKENVGVSSTWKWEGDNIDLNVDVETPYKGYQNQEITFTHRGPIDNFNTKLEAKLPFKSMKRFTTEYTHKVNRNGFDCQYTFTSTNRYLSDIAGSIKHTGDLKNFKTEVSGSSSGKAINTATEFNLASKSGKFHLDTPFEQVKNVDVMFAHNGDLKNFNNEATFAFNAMPITYEGRLSSSPVSGNFKLTTPFEPVRELETTFNHDGNARSFSNSGSVKYNGRQINAKSALNLNRMNGNVHIDTPYRSFNTLDASFEHQGRNWRSFVSQGSVDVNGQKYDGKTTFNADSGSASVNLNTPHRAMRNLELSGNHNGDSWRSFENAGAVVFNGRKYEAKSKIDADAGYGNVQVNTPHREIRNIDISMTHAGNGWQSFDNTGEVTYNGQKYATKTTFNAEGPSGSFKLETPHDEVRNLDVAFEHNGRNWRNWENNANVNYNGQQYSGESNFRWNRGFLRSAATVKIPEEYGFKVNHKGDASNFNNKLVIDMGRPYTMGSSFNMAGDNVNGEVYLDTPYRQYRNQKLSFNHNGNGDRFETTGAIETSIRGYPKFDFKVTHNGQRKVDTNVEVNTPIPGYERFAAGLNHVQRRRSINTVASVETPFPGYEKMSVNLDHDGHLQDFKTNMRVKTPIPQYEDFGIALAHSGDLSSFESTTTIDLPLEAVPRVTISVRHTGNLADFTTSGTVEYNNKKVEGKVAFKKTSSYYESNYEGTFELKCPCQYVRDLSIVAAHNRKTEIKTGKLDITHNGEKKLDFDYSYNTEGFRNIRITVREPRAMETEMNIRDSARMAGDASFNWNTNEADSNIRFEFGFKNIKEPSNIDQELTLKTHMPRRTVGITVGHVRTDSRYNRNAEIIWGNDDASRISYDFDINTAMRRSQNMYDGSFKLNTPVYDFVGSFNHKTIPGVQYTTEIIMETGERLTIKNDLLMTHPGYKHTISVNHPRFSKPASVTTEGNFKSGEVSGKITVAFEHEEMTYEGRVADESRGSTKKYSASTRAQHRSSRLDFQWEGTMECSSDNHEASTSVSYLTSRGETKTASLRAVGGNGELTVDVETPVENYKLTAKKDIDEYNGVYRYSGVASCSDNTMRAEVQLNKLEKCVEAKIYYNSEDYVHAYAKYMTPSHMQAELYHTTDGERTSDMLASIALKEGQLINGHAYVRPTMYRDLRYISNNRRFNAKASRFMDELSSAISQEYRMKTNSLQRSARPISNLVDAIAEDVNEKMTATSRMYQRLYDNNEYYVRDIADACSKAYTTASYKMAELKSCIDRKIAIVNQHMTDLYMRTTHRLNIAYERFEANMEQMKVRIAVLKQKYQPYIDNAAEIVKEKLMRLVDRVRTSRTMNAYWRKLSNIDIYQPYRQAKAYIARRTAEYSQRYAPQISQVRRIVMWINQRPETQRVKQYIKQKFDNSKWLINYLEVEQKAREYLAKYREGGWDYIKQQISVLADKYIQFNRNAFSWDAENNDLRFDIFVPVELRDLQSVPNLNLKQHLRTVRNMIDAITPEESDWTMWDYFYMYKPSADIANWVPPFKGRAAIAGSQHYMTFDKTFFEFAGECSYLLARDFIDGEFYVTVNYDNVLGQVTKKSITVGSKGHTAEIFSDAKVIVDGARSEMPVVIDKTSIKRIGNTIRLDNSMGLTVTCDLIHDRCTVNVTGWYFGKTAGLMGTYNNEPIDDMTTADRTIISNTEDFASSWSMGRRCRAVNNAVMVSPSSNNRRYRLCAQLFEDSDSQFRPCFRIVNPEPFITMCMNDMPINENRIETEEDTCNMAAFYVDECKREGVNIRVPSTCVRCEMANDGAEFIEGEDVEITGESVPQSADTVFVIQHADCNEQLLDKVMDIAVALDKNLKSTDVVKNKYAIVGFGGEGPLATPHVHTMDGQIFNSRDKIQAGLENFNVATGGDKDILRALRFASNLPFRGGVSKNIILLPCDKCQEGLVSYAEIQQVLLQKDIRLHVMIQELFTLKGKAKSDTIFGADKDGVFTKKSVNDDELNGDATLARFVSLPKDICVPLTEESDGSVWSSKQFLESRPTMQKKQLDVMVRVIAKKAKPTDCQICECVPDETGVGKSECRSCTVRNPIYDLLPLFEEDDFFPGEQTVEFSKVTETEKKSKKERKNKKLKNKKKLKMLKSRRNQEPN